MADPARAHALKQELEQSMDAYKRLQADVTKAVNASSQLHSQEVENAGVLEELKRLDDDANVYKLIGPALIKQDLVEAKSNVSKRLEYIKGEMERADGQIKALEGKQKEKEAELMKLDKKMQAMGLANPA